MNINLTFLYPNRTSCSAGSLNFKREHDLSKYLSIMPLISVLLAFFSSSSPLPCRPSFNDFIDVGEIVLEFNLTVDAIIFMFPAAVSQELVIYRKVFLTSQYF